VLKEYDEYSLKACLEDEAQIRDIGAGIDVT
jgi:hypothetical protein